MTSLQKTSHANFVRQRRTPKTPSVKTPKKTTQTAQKAYHPASVYLPAEPRRVVRRTVRQAQGNVTSRSTKAVHRNGFDIAFTLGRTKVHAPVLNIPELGPRWVSAAMTLVLSFMLFTMWTASPLTVKAAELHGNQRLSLTEINSMLGMIGKPIFSAVPAQIETNLYTAFPDLESVKVRISFPSRISVDIKERTPVMVWSQNGNTTLIDASGVAFPLRGEIPALLQVSATGAPTGVQLDPALPIYKQKFIAPEMVNAMLVLAPVVPAGMTMTFDPQYGMGWKDPRGWSVYFGQTTKDIPMKMMVYQAIVDTLTLQGVQPSLISVEYLNAPFYK